MIALPFHPSNAYTIRELNENPYEILHAVEEEAKKTFGDKVALHLTDKIIPVKKKYAIQVDQGVIAGCAGGLYENLVEASAILHDHSTGNGYFSLNVYPASVPVSMAITKNGVAAELLESAPSSKPPSAGPASARGTSRPMAASRSATPPAISPTARAPSPARGSFRPSP